MNFPDNCKYTEDHEWIRLVSDHTAYVGITDFAQSELGDVVYVEVATVGQTLESGKVFGTVEAVKTTSDLFLPIDGKVLEANMALDANAELVNQDPYGEGWIIKLEITNASQLDNLMNAEAYKAHVGA